MDEIAKVNLEKPLLLRDPVSSLISVNFNPHLVALLREVKYLEQREGTEYEIPQSAAGVFAQHETYRKYLQVSNNGTVVLKWASKTFLRVKASPRLSLALDLPLAQPLPSGGDRF